MLSIEREIKKKKIKKKKNSDFQQEIGSHEGQEEESTSHLEFHSWEHSSWRHHNTHLAHNTPRQEHFRRKRLKIKEKQMLWNKTTDKNLVFPKDPFRKFIHALNVWYCFVLQCKAMSWKKIIVIHGHENCRIISDYF